MALEPKLIELFIVKGAEFRRQATEGPDKPELRGDDVNDETKPSLLRKLEAILGFTLRPQRADLPPQEGSCSGCCSCTPQK